MRHSKNNYRNSVYKKIENNIIFEATVPDQNEGRTIQFTLNNEIEVTVLDDEGMGFSYTQLKQIIK